MIQIEEIEIVEFRGIRHLKRSLGRRSFGIAGPNGTGKSGIVDASNLPSPETSLVSAVRARRS